MAILFISHKLDEVRAVSDRIAVLRAGRWWRRSTRRGGRPGGAGAGHGRPQRRLGRARRRARRAPPASRVVCALRGASVARSGERPPLSQREPRGARRRGAGDRRRGRQRAAHAGRPAVGAACRCDAARSRWPAARCRPTRARSCAPASRASPKTARASARSATCRCGRTRCSSVMRAGASPAGACCARGKARDHARSIVERFDVRGAGALGLDAPARALSGGNLQKLILGRALTGAALSRDRAAADRGAPADLGPRRRRGRRRCTGACSTPARPVPACC